MYLTREIRRSVLAVCTICMRKALTGMWMIRAGRLTFVSKGLQMQAAQLLRVSRAARSLSYLSRRFLRPFLLTCFSQARVPSFHLAFRFCSEYNSCTCRAQFPCTMGRERITGKTLELYTDMYVLEYICISVSYRIIVTGSIFPESIVIPRNNWRPGNYSRGNADSIFRRVFLRRGRNNDREMCTSRWEN